MQSASSFSSSTRLLGLPACCAGSWARSPRKSVRFVSRFAGLQWAFLGMMVIHLKGALCPGEHRWYLIEPLIGVRCRLRRPTGVRWSWA